MNKLILAILFFSSNCFAIEEDKVKHYVTTLAISTISYDFFKGDGVTKNERRAVAFFAAFTVGLIKEMQDEKFDKEDLLYDALGAATPVMLTFEF